MMGVKISVYDKQVAVKLDNALLDACNLEWGDKFSARFADGELVIKHDSDGSLTLRKTAGGGLGFNLNGDWVASCVDEKIVDKVGREEIGTITATVSGDELFIPLPKKMFKSRKKGFDLLPGRGFANIADLC